MRRQWRGWKLTYSGTHTADDRIQHRKGEGRREEEGRRDMTHRSCMISLHPPTADEGNDATRGEEGQREAERDMGF